MRIENVGELSEKFKFYRCGSPNQKEFLVENGIEYVYSYRSTKTDRVVWVFILTNRLQNLLELWTSNKPKGGVENG